MRPSLISFALLQYQRDKWRKVNLQKLGHLDEESNDLIIELRSLFGLVDLRNINHGVHNRGNVFLEGLAINEAAYRPDYLDFEVNLFLLLVVIRPRNHSHQQWNYQVQVVILRDTL